MVSLLVLIHSVSVPLRVFFFLSLRFLHLKVYLWEFLRPRGVEGLGEVPRLPLPLLYGWECRHPGLFFLQPTQVVCIGASELSVDVTSQSKCYSTPLSSKATFFTVFLGSGLFLIDPHTERRIL